MTGEGEIIHNTRTVSSFCRFCGAACGMQMTIDSDDRIVSIRGDRANPLSRGYACFKGLQAEHAHHGPQRMIRHQKRGADGKFVDIDTQAALDEIAGRLDQIIEDHGPNSVAVLAGGASYLTASSHTMYQSFLRAIGSDQNFTVSTIDQSAKMVSFERLGGWAAGVQDLETSDVALLVGTNPLVAHTTVGFMTTDPTRRLKEAKARGLKLISIDPRRTETARYADLVLQPLPGYDAMIVAAMLKIILAEGWHDAAFCAEFVGADRLADLAAAVEPFDDALVEGKADLAAGQIRSAAQMFARDSKRGSAFTATGPSMGPFSNLMQHMVDTLNVVCGRFLRSGDRFVCNPRDPARTVHAEVIAATRSWEGKAPSRTRGVRHIFGERMTGTLADEILTPGDGQIRALIIDGCNGANCIPDQHRVVEAFRSLDLLVVIDPNMTVSAELADYIISPNMPFERADLPIYSPGYALQHDSAIQYTPAVLAPPKGGNTIDAWRFYWEIARRLDTSIEYNGVSLDMEQAPSTDDLLAILMRDAAIPFDEVKRHPSGKRFDFPHAIVQPARQGHTARFDVMPEDIRQECASLVEWNGRPKGRSVTGQDCTHLLSSRRLRDVHNSSGTLISTILARKSFNPAYMNPDDMERMSLMSGNRIEIASASGKVSAIVEPDPDLRRGVVNLAHGWGGLPGTDENEDRGSSVNLLTDDEADCESINAMPRMSAIPVSIHQI